ncbi:MAG: triphosphoribosyl-dephospho-CoA synthase [Planctomycetota bacterium]
MFAGTARFLEQYAAARGGGGDMSGAATERAIAGAPPLTLGGQVTLACLWEATAPKPGNVYRGADFEDLTYADFVTSAAVAGPAIESTITQGVGRAMFEAVRATQAAVATNTNLGLVLLIGPLAAVEDEAVSQEAVLGVLDRLDAEDTRWVYEAIRAATPGGLGEAEEADVRDAPPEEPLRDVMALAAERDLVARQYANGFAEVRRLAERIGDAAAAGTPLADAIVDAFVGQIAECPDTLISRKLGAEVAAEASAHAGRAAASKKLGPDAYRAALGDLDFWLRADGHRRNPGATADLIGAALFVLLRRGRLRWPVRFYGTEGGER